jgi:hypothetical protein
VHKSKSKRTSGIYNKLSDEVVKKQLWPQSKLQYEYAGSKISESVPLLNLNMRRIRIIRNEILKSDMFRKSGALKSSTKLYYDNLLIPLSF